MKKFIKNWILPLFIACIFATVIHQNVLAVAKTEVNIDNKYQVNDRLVFTKFNKSNIAVGDYILFNDNSVNKVRKATKVNSDNVVILDNGKEITISKSNIQGKILFKIF